MVLLAMVGCGGSPEDSPSSGRNGGETPEEKIVGGVESGSDGTKLPTPDDVEADPRIAAPVETPGGEMATEETEKKWTSEELQELGIRQFESDDFVLWTDAVTAENQQEFRRLPELARDFLSQLEQRIRRQRPGFAFADDLPFRGTIMDDVELFLQAELVPEELREIQHGLYRKNRFWMREQQTPYYRRHLMFHELVHCVLDRFGFSLPVWYHEGMAELLAVHGFDASGELRIEQIPGEEQIAGGFGRIGLIRRDLERNRFRRLVDLREVTGDEFYPHQTSYAWSWAMCKFLSRHPQTADDFQELLASQSRNEFERRVDAMNFQNPQLSADWASFVSQLEADMEIEPTLIQWMAGKSGGSENEFSISASRSWQNSGIEVKAGTTYEIEATGEFVVNQEPQPWVSEPQGVSVEYVNGQPLGLLQMVNYSADEPGTAGDYGFLQPLEIGRGTQWTAPHAGELFFGINEHASGWSNNSGALQIRVMAGE